MNTFNNFRNLIFTISALISISALLWFTDLYKQSVTDGLLGCCNVLVPSLFPFFFLSSFIVYSDCFSVVTKKLSWAEKLTGISPQGLLAVLLCVIGGFPVGGRVVSSLFSQGKITENEAKRLSYICVGAGPGFIVTFVGEGIFGNKALGLLLLVASVSSVVTLVMLSRFIPLKKDNIPLKNNTQYSIGESIVKGTESAVRSTLSMCGFVVIFVVINNLMSLLPYYNGVIATLLEITSGMINFGNDMNVILVAFLIGFGGICVHFQIFGIIKNINISKVLFFLVRILQGLISALYIHILLYFFPVAEQVFSSMEENTVPQLSSTAWGGGGLILLSIIFLLSIKKSEVNLCVE